MCATTGRGQDDRDSDQWMFLARIDGDRSGEAIVRDVPSDIKLIRAERLLEISWREETPRRYDIRRIRCACACARCVDERTGVRTLDVDTVPDNIGITDMELVGNYAIKFSFSDGHDTGIYSWDRLYDIQAIQ